MAVRTDGAGRCHLPWRFRPGPSNLDGFGTPAEQGTRARQFLDAYGATPQQRGTTAFLLVPRLQALVDFMHTAADAGNANFAHHIAEGHADLYRQDISYISARIEGWREIIIEDGIQP